MGAFAIYHGHAHGTQLPVGQNGLTYSIGFVVATGCLHGVGITIGLIHRWPTGRVELLHGGLNGAGIAESPREALGLVGIVSALFAIVALSAAFVVSLRAPWMRIAVRVGGIWVVAIGLLMLGWSLRT